MDITRFVVIVRMWWPTGNSQLEVIGVLYSIMNLTCIEFNSIMNSLWKKKGMLSPFCGETRKGKEKQRSEPLSLCCSFFIILFWLMAVYLQGHKQPEIWMKQQRGLGSCQNQVRLWQRYFKHKMCEETLLKMFWMRWVFWRIICEDYVPLFSFCVAHRTLGIVD